MNSSSTSSSGFSARFWLFASLLMFWLLLTQSLAADEVLAGVIISLLIVVLSPQSVSQLSGFKPGWLFPLHFAQFLGLFLWALIRSNFDMARRVLSPQIPLQPELVEVSTELQSELARLILANCITLTPGTLSVDINANTLLVHWIDCSDPQDLSANTAAIVQPFESALKKFLV